MKETLNANIGSRTFTIDTDAYETLRSYLDDIRRRLPEGDTETIRDIETRMAEIFLEKTGTSAMRVVTIGIVREAMLQMGAPADFGECRGQQQQPTGEEGQRTEPRKLYRSRTEHSIAGICGGLAQFFDTDPSLLRLVTLLLILFGGLSIWVYIILWIVIPLQPAPQNNTNNKKE